MSDLYEQYLNALKGKPSPSLFLDLDAFELNIDWIQKNAGDKTIRIATKSVRSVEILKRTFAGSKKFKGLMTYSLREALWLRAQGFDDILMGYPTLDREALSELADDPEGIVLMVDLPEHIDMLESVYSKKKFKICLDVDLSMDLPGVRFGVYRSAIGGPRDLHQMVERLNSAHTVELIGLMGYEAQIAGLGDKHSFLIRLLKSLSIPKLRAKRAQTFLALQLAGHKITLVNGGGTGSLDTTREEECVTELTVGSGLYAPGLFDHYQKFALSPALAFTLPIVRRPCKNIITCWGGGYIASGAIEKSKLPVPYLPAGLSLLSHEGAGEVQTPLKNNSERELKIGDLVIMRHAKAGEVCEHFKEIHLVREGNLLGSVPTYRGDGKCFL
jgi:D-serine deaminase-like pyridoxal phosphate-dependent protein